MINLTCAWCLIANATLFNVEWPDLNSQYYATIVNKSNINISGNFPNARYFSFQLYDINNWIPYWDTHDNKIKQTNNPYINPDISYNNSINYNINIDVPYDNESILIYRIYDGIDAYGGVELPIITVDNSTIQACDKNDRPVISIQDTNSSIKLYETNKNNNFYLPENNNKLFENYDARYLVSYYNNSYNDFNGAIIQIKLPIFPYNLTDISYLNYDVRYFSISIIDLSSPKQTIQTISDQELIKYADNNISTIYLSCHKSASLNLQLHPPSSIKRCNNVINYFGVLYRQLLPKFRYEIPNLTKASNDTLQLFMQDYYPLIYWV